MRATTHSTASSPCSRELRGCPELTERSRGTFYKKSQAFVHFHEDPAGLFADVRLVPGGEFTAHAREHEGRAALVHDSRAPPERLLSPDVR